jgi:hypothetical protein
MKKMIVSIRDVKTREYLGLVQVVNWDDAKRSFMGLCMEPKSPLYRFPRDFRLHVVGEFDVSSGKITATETVEDITPYDHVEHLINKRERAELADYKADESMRASVDYFKNVGKSPAASV